MTFYLVRYLESLCKNESLESDHSSLTVNLNFSRNKAFKWPKSIILWLLLFGSSSQSALLAHDPLEHVKGLVGCFLSLLLGISRLSVEMMVTHKVKKTKVCLGEL